MDIIQAFARSGYRLFPLHGKKPAVEKGRDWGEYPKDPEATRLDFLGNYAIHVEYRLVIDVDCKNNQPGKQSFAKLKLDLGLPQGWESQTFVVRTGTGGFHIYLDLPVPGINIQKHHKDYPGLEFLSGNFYVVGPDSIHPDTQEPYKVVFGTPENLAMAPQKLLDLLQTTAEERLGPEPAQGFVDDDPLNIERFKDVLKSMPVVSVGNQRNSAYIAACRGRDLGLSLAVCVGVLNKYYNGVKLVPPIQQEEVEESAKNAYRYAKGKAGSLNVKAIFQTTDVGNYEDPRNFEYDRDQNGHPKKTLNNAVNYLRSIPSLREIFRLNTFTGNIEISSSAPWFLERGSAQANMESKDISLLKYILAKTVRVEFVDKTLEDAIIVVAHKKHYHPVRNYLSSLKWDGIPRIDRWLIDYGHAIDTPYTRAVGRKVLCAAVKRVFEPGCKYDFVLVIEGRQGIGKSTACRILGRAWGGEMNLDPHHKDAIHMMQGKWIIELSEMTALKWSDQNALKAFFSRQTDTTRLSYERHAKDYPRQCIFIGTVNPEHIGYLKDLTGNRRYWIVEFRGMTDVIRLEQDCDQLWAEAMLAYQKEVLYLQGEAADLQIMEAQRRMPEDTMLVHVQRWSHANRNIDEIGVADIMEYLGIAPMKATRSDQSRIAQALIDLGWEKKSIREGIVTSTRYCRPAEKVTVDADTI